jgi:hypothetical protein
VIDATMEIGLCALYNVHSLAIAAKHETRNTGRDFLGEVILSLKVGDIYMLFLKALTIILDK